MTAISAPTALKFELGASIPRRGRGKIKITTQEDMQMRRREFVAGLGVAAACRFLLRHKSRKER
jgi:hypothetical protein